MGGADSVAAGLEDADGDSPGVSRPVADPGLLGSVAVTLTAMNADRTSDQTTCREREFMPSTLRRQNARHLVPNVDRAAAKGHNI